MTTLRAPRRDAVLRARVRRLAAIGAGCALGAGVVACGGGDSGRAAATPDPRGADPTATPRNAPAPRTAAEHLRALQRIADEHGGTRAAGTAGDRASQSYVARRLRDAGWRVGSEAVEFPFFEERSPARLGGAREGDDFRAITYSGSGRAEARVAEARGLGCSASDWRGVARGRIAVVERGTCTFAAKTRFAQDRGAAAVLVVSDDGVRGATLGEPGARIPALIVDADTGRDVLDRGRATVSVDAVSETRRTRNVIATKPGVRTGEDGDPVTTTRGKVVAAGAHLDSVPAGPGANDNASGSAALLAAAERLGPTKRPVWLGFWGAEELGLFGSREHVAELSAADRKRIVGYVNLDMVGTPEGRVRVSSPDALLRDTLASAIRGSGRDPQTSESLNGSSDHASFARAGIPSAFLFTGLDRCYHRRCDTADKVDTTLLDDVAGATQTALRRLADR